MEFLVALTPLAIFPAGTDTIFILCLIVLPALLVFFTAQYMMKQHIANSVQLVKTEILKTNLNTFTPLKLQAYERIALFLERTSIPALIQSYAQAGQSARGFAAAATHAIKEEYSYNVSQQIYIEYLQSMEVQPQDRGLEFMKNEIALTLGQ
ncbi:MAG: hypothetical protein EBT66_08025 [Bacteroidetes bacterium]|nr:hypothetical protein [Bacteroidota bacterium]